MIWISANQLKALSIFSHMDYETVHAAKLIITLSSMTVILLAFIAHKHDLADVKNKLKYALPVLATLALFSYFNLGQLHFKQGYLGTYDAFHYYMGSKYFKELQYKYLYEATLVAAHELDSPLYQGIKKYRDQSTYQIVKRKQAFENISQWRDRFSEKRWSQFKSDLNYFVPRLSKRGWRNVFQDKGYNPTPVWTFLGKLFTYFIPAQEGIGMKLLMHLDVLLMIVMFAMIWKAFGSDIAWLSMIFFGINVSTPYSSIGGSLLRLDWLCWIVCSLCLMKLNRYAMAGGLWAYASLLRISPVLYILPLAAHFIASGWRQKNLPTEGKNFIWGAAISSVILMVATHFWVGPAHISWKPFIEKISLHQKSLGTKRYGVKYLFVWDGETTRKDIGKWKEYDKRKIERLQKTRIPRVIFQILLTGALLWIARFLKPWEAFSLGCLLVFILLSPTRYYYAQWVTLIPLLAIRWENSRRVAGLLMLLATMAAGCFLFIFNPFLAFFQFAFSVIFLMFILFLIHLFYQECRELFINKTV